MISSIRGILTNITDQYALVENNGVYYEILLPSALAERLKNSEIGDEIEFKTIYYIEAGDRKSNHYPRLVGFLDNIDREFFSLFTQVPGMGIKKALKSLIIPIKDIATAIEMKNPSGLSLLPGVGGRLAEKIIAELHGKTSKFALSKVDQPLAVKDTKKTLEPLEKEAIDVLIQLQYKMNEAQEMVSRAVLDNPKVSKVEDLISIIFKNVQSNQ
jgi:Holliday junction DNA helicase RuvA